MSRVVALALEFLEELAHFPGILAAGPSVGTTRTGKISRLGAKERGKWPIDPRCQKRRIGFTAAESNKQVGETGLK
jgi:hypothetical protein